MTRQSTALRKGKRERAKAEDVIAKATEEALAQAAQPKEAKPRRKTGEWPCTAEQIVAERDGAGRSWKQVAINLNLGSPGQARKAYTDLTGRPHHESQAIVKRATRGTATNRKVDSPGWDDDSDQGEIEARLNGEWVEESGSGQNYTPAHWTGSMIVVERTVRETATFIEEVLVGRVVEFTFGPKGDQPLQVWVVQKDTGAMRCFRVADIKEVR